jgi:hypothetical protein
LLAAHGSKESSGAALLSLLAKPSYAFKLMSIHRNMLLCCICRFAGDWHTIAWLHSTAEASAWEKVVSNECTTAHFSTVSGPARQQSAKHQAARDSGSTATSSSKNAAIRGANSTSSGGNRSASFGVRFTHRTQPMQGSGAESGTSSAKQQEAKGLPTVVHGRGRIPERTSPARLQVGAPAPCQLC